MISRLAALAMRRPRHHTLIFHRVVQETDPMSPGEPTQKWFSGLMSMLSSHFEVISLTDAVARSQSGRLDHPTVSVTFDDGYADNYTLALPVLEQFNIPATFFVATGFVNGGRMWNDSIIETFRRLESGVYEIDPAMNRKFELNGWESRRVAAAETIRAWKHLPPKERQSRVEELAVRVPDLPSDLMMTVAQLRALADSPVATIGGHTRNHPILASISDDEAAQEIEGGKSDLEDWVQREIMLFAYPNGKFGTDYLAQHATLAKQAGFTAAVATDWGTLGTSGDRYAIPRFTPWQKNLSRFSLDLLRCHYDLI